MGAAVSLYEFFLILGAMGSMIAAGGFVWQCFHTYRREKESREGVKEYDLRDRAVIYTDESCYQSDGPYSWYFDVEGGGRLFVKEDFDSSVTHQYLCTFFKGTPWQYKRFLKRMGK